MKLHSLFIFNLMIVWNMFYARPNNIIFVLHNFNM